jgi:homoserine O-succinyltransferase
MSISVHSHTSTIPAAHRITNIPVAEFRDVNPDCIHIGLVNNMPDAVLEATERQFRSLIGLAAEEAGGRRAVRLSLFAMPEVPRSDEGRRHIARSYSNIGDLWNHRLDGLIVTGAEPLASKLTDEPYWGSLARLTEWADHNTDSSVWSCLAAHAALLQLDGIVRRPLGEKLSGIFECAVVADHPLTDALPAIARTPHSRWNEVSEDALDACGYRVLTRSAHAGVDAFVKQKNSLFVFFQGHPEYEADSLFREYRRDIRRFLRGEKDSYPAMPQGYFDEETTAILTAVRDRALSDCRDELLAYFPAALLQPKTDNTWRPAAVNIYRNWLLRLGAQKEQRMRRRW